MLTFFEFMQKNKRRRRNHFVSGFSERSSILVDANTFLKMYEADPQSVANCKLILPEIGSNELGKFEIVLQSDSNLVEAIYE